MLKYFKKFISSNADLNTVQDNISDIYIPLLRNPLLDGIVLKDITVPAAGSLIEHKLGRDVIGWFIVDQSANVVVWRESYKNNSFIKLKSSVDCTVSLYIF